MTIIVKRIRKPYHRMAFLHRLNDLLALAERTLVVLLLSALLGLALLQVTLRNVLSSGLFGADALIRHMVLWLGFLGASLAAYEQRHLGIDLLTRTLPAKAQSWIMLLCHLIAMLVCMLLTSAAWTFVQSERQAGTLLTVGLPTWLGQTIMPIGFLSLTLRFTIRFLTTCLQLMRGQSS